jgi:hypothetical protein
MTSYASIWPLFFVMMVVVTGLNHLDYGSALISSCRVVAHIRPGRLWWFHVDRHDVDDCGLSFFSFSPFIHSLYLSLFDS